MGFYLVAVENSFISSGLEPATLGHFLDGLRKITKTLRQKCRYTSRHSNLGHLA
jgi:hypothetical protein